MQNSDKISISFLVLAFKVEKYIKECLESLINQYNPDKINYEVCLCLDNSYKESFKESIFQFYAEKYPFIRFLFDDMLGTQLNDSRNLLMQNANGEYIIFVDGDDFISNQFIFYTYPIIREHAPDILTTKVLSFNEKSSWLLYGHENISGHLLEINQNDPIVMGMEFYYPGLHGKLFKRSLANLFHLEINFPEDDKPMTMLMYLHSNKILYLDIVGAFYRTHESSRMSQHPTFTTKMNNKEFYNVMMEQLELQLDNIMSQIKKPMKEDVINLMKYSLLMVSLNFFIHKYQEFRHRKNIFKAKKEVITILSVMHDFYEKHIKASHQEEIIYHYLDNKFLYFLHDLKYKPFLIEHNSFYRFLSIPRVIFLKVKKNIRF